MKVREESQKAGLRLSIQKTKMVASSPITSWHILGGKVEASQVLLSWAPEPPQMATAAMALSDAYSSRGVL